MQLVTVAAYPDAIAAHLAVARLVGEGIQSSTADEHIVSADWFYTGAVGGVKVQVHPKDLDRALFPGVQGGPLMHAVAAKAVAFKEALEPGFADYQRRVVANAQALAAALAELGWRIVSGGTDNHLLLVDVFSSGVTGKVAEKALERAAITVNKNTIPFDTQPPLVASGVRLGTPAVTSRGMKEPEMAQIAAWIDEVAQAPGDETRKARIAGEVKELCAKFPAPGL